MRLRLFAVLLLLLASGCAGPDCGNYQRLDLGGWPVRAEVRPGAHPLALADLPQLTETTGVLYKFESFDTYFITMEGAVYAVDLIWLDAVNRIVTISKNALPCPKQAYCVYAPDLPVSSVLVVPAGFAERHGVQKGSIAGVAEGCTFLDKLLGHK